MSKNLITLLVVKQIMHKFLRHQNSKAARAYALGFALSGECTAQAKMSQVARLTRRMPNGLRSCCNMVSCDPATYPVKSSAIYET